MREIVGASEDVRGMLVGMRMRCDASREYSVREAIKR